jgi:hypothetical protein
VVFAHSLDPLLPFKFVPMKGSNAQGAGRSPTTRRTGQSDLFAAVPVGAEIKIFETPLVTRKMGAFER